MSYAGLRVFRSPAKGQKSFPEVIIPSEALKPNRVTMRHKTPQSADQAEASMKIGEHASEPNHGIPVCTL